jgi:hypothetical protein
MPLSLVQCLQDHYLITDRRGCVNPGMITQLPKHKIGQVCPAYPHSHTFTYIANPDLA